jgi:hypothetical protein
VRRPVGELHSEMGGLAFRECLPVPGLGELQGMLVTQKVEFGFHLSG